MIDGGPAKQGFHTKSLGVHIDENLSWNMHIHEIAKKIASGTGGLKHIGLFVPTKTLHTIFNSLVQPHINYCCVVWDNRCKTLATNEEGIGKSLGGVPLACQKVCQFNKTCRIAVARQG